uniref:Uncharacterized protein n=1 Tax=Rhizophagus irregularis TaxID=588596 RepID=I6XFH8_9GLOM|nr:hypothetical protein [Rhizophagus irregularis]AFN42496.1 hypothetical protein [Rhizophagus irregularis]
MFHLSTKEWLSNEISSRGLSAPCLAADILVSSEWVLPNIELLDPLLVSDINCRVSREWVFPKWAALSLALASTEREIPNVEPAVGLKLYLGQIRSIQYYSRFNTSLGFQYYETKVDISILY